MRDVDPGEPSGSLHCAEGVHVAPAKAQADTVSHGLWLSSLQLVDKPKFGSRADFCAWMLTASRSDLQP
jgi:hypothetical protein